MTRLIASLVRRGAVGENKVAWEEVFLWRVLGQGVAPA